MSDAGAIDLAFLALVGVLAGWINSVAGAGSLLLLPALIFTGLPADSANATNRIAVLATTLAALAGYRRAGFSIGRSELVLTVAAAMGGGVGSFLATLLEADAIQIATVVAMAFMLALSLLPVRREPERCRTSDEQPLERREEEFDERSGFERCAVRDEVPGANGPEESSQPRSRLPAPRLGMIVAFVLIGVYGGFLQAGLGILVLLYLSLVHRVGLVASNVVKSSVTLALNVVALAVFGALGERIDVIRGGVLAGASAIGGLLGARTTVALGDRWVRRFVTLAVLASMAKLIADML